MNIETALYNLGVREDTLSIEEKKQLDDKGFLPIPDVMSSHQISAFRRRLEELIRIEGESAGIEVHQEEGSMRLSNLINKGEMFDFCYTHPKLLAAIKHILTSDFKVHSLNCRFSIPGAGHQGFHMDWGASKPEEKKRFEDGEYFVANSLWLLDDLTEKNGATRLVPGSHHFKNSPSEMMENPQDPYPGEVHVVAPAGTVVVFNGHTWHGGTLNRSDDYRRLMHMAFIRRELPQQTDQKKYLLPETDARLTDEMRVLLDV